MPASTAAIVAVITATSPAASTAAIIAVITATPAPASTAAIIAVVSTAPAPTASARRCTVITLNIDQLTGNTGIRQAIKDRAVQVLRQLNQREVAADGDAAEVLGVQAALVGQGADDRARADVLALTHVQTVGVEVAAVVEAAATAPIPAIVAVKAVAPAPAPSIAAFTSALPLAATTFAPEMPMKPLPTSM